METFNELKPFTQVCLTICFMAGLCFMAYFWKKFTE